LNGARKEVRRESPYQVGSSLMLGIGCSNFAFGCFSFGSNLQRISFSCFMRLCCSHMKNEVCRRKTCLVGAHAAQTPISTNIDASIGKIVQRILDKAPFSGIALGSTTTTVKTTGITPIAIVA
jgi:hypothetical protein